jgi:hypothetical protein
MVALVLEELEDQDVLGSGVAEASGMLGFLTLHMRLMLKRKLSRSQVDQPGRGWNWVMVKH